MNRLHVLWLRTWGLFMGLRDWGCPKCVIPVELGQSGKP